MKISYVVLYSSLAISSDVYMLWLSPYHRRCLTITENRESPPTWRASVGRVAEAEGDIEAEGEHIADSGWPLDDPRGWPDRCPVMMTAAGHCDHWLQRLTRVPLLSIPEDNFSQLRFNFTCCLSFKSSFTFIIKSHVWVKSLANDLEISLSDSLDDLNGFEKSFRDSKDLTTLFTDSARFLK